MLLVALLLILGQAPESNLAGLEETALSFWNALAKHDKVSAMKSVYEEDLNHFLNRQEPEFRNPRIVKVVELSDTTARVVVSIERFLPNGVFTFESDDLWIKTDGGWKARVDPPRSVAERIHAAAGKAKAVPLPEELQLKPERLIFYAMNPKQSAKLTIANGLPSPARIVEVEFDSARMSVAEKIETIDPGQSAQLEFSYIGEKLPEFNVEDSLKLRIEQDGAVRVFEVPVVYNFLNEIQRWILNQERARRTKKP